MKNTLIYKLLAFLLIIFLIFWYSKSRNIREQSFNDLYDGEKVLITFNKSSNPLLVEVVNSSETTTRGLSGRDEIGSDGMLFIFPNSYVRTFWMFNMRFNLDFVWIKDNVVVGVNRNIKKPIVGTKNEDIKRVSISSPSNKVLEINAGDIDKYGIRIGDRISLLKNKN